MCTTALSSDWPKPNLLIEQRHRMKIELRSMFVSCLTSLYAWHFVLEFQANWIVCLWHVSYFVTYIGVIQIELQFDSNQSSRVHTLLIFHNSTVCAACEQSAVSRPIYVWYDVIMLCRLHTNTMYRIKVTSTRAHNTTSYYTLGNSNIYIYILSESVECNINIHFPHTAHSTYYNISTYVRKLCLFATMHAFNHR